jgi:hypothetical protein
MCNGLIETATQTKLIAQVQAHAKEAHDKDLTAEQVLQMEKDQAK